MYLYIERSLWSAWTKAESRAASKQEDGCRRGSGRAVQMNKALHNLLIMGSNGDGCQFGISHSPGADSDTVNPRTRRFCPSQILAVKVGCAH